MRDSSDGGDKERKKREKEERKEEEEVSLNSCSDVKGDGGRKRG
jgi:hypothetical protein